MTSSNSLSQGNGLRQAALEAETLRVSALLPSTHLDPSLAKALADSDRENQKLLAQAEKQMSLDWAKVSHPLDP